MVVSLGLSLELSFPSLRPRFLRSQQNARAWTCPPVLITVYDTRRFRTTSPGPSRRCDEMTVLENPPALRTRIGCIRSSPSDGAGAFRRQKTSDAATRQIWTASKKKETNSLDYHITGRGRPRHHAPLHRLHVQLQRRLANTPNIANHKTQRDERRVFSTISLGMEGPQRGPI